MNHYSLEIMANDRIAQQRREAAQHNLALPRRGAGMAAWRTGRRAVAARLVAATGALHAAAGRLRRLVVRLAASA